jgi:hypothetical protein
MYACLIQMASLNALVSINANAFSEILFWNEHIKKMNFVYTRVQCSPMQVTSVLRAI